MGHFNKLDYSRNYCMLDGIFKRKGYDWWWHSFTAKNAKTGEEKPFFIEFFIVNPALHPDHTSFGKNDEKPSYLMIKCGTWGKGKTQIHNFYPLSEVEITNKPTFEIKAKDNYLSETALKGSVSLSEEESKNHPEYLSSFGSISFDLKISREISFNVGYGASKLFRFIKAFQMYWHASGMKSTYEGKIIFNNEEYIVSKDTSYGYSDKNWGSDFTSPWLWLSSNHIYSNISKKYLTNTVFDIGGGRPKIYFVPLNRKLLSAFYYQGQEIEFNFSKFWEGIHTEFDFHHDDSTCYWKVKQSSFKYVIDVNIACLKKDMLFINYENPLGKQLFHHLYNGGNGFGNIKLYKKVHHQLVLIDDMDVKNVGCEYGEFD